jgi:hypothetical protein
MARQSNPITTEVRTLRTRVLGVLGAFTLGLALLLTGIAPLAVASHNGADLRYGQAVFDGNDASGTSITRSFSRGHSTFPHRNAVAPRGEAPLLSMIADAAAAPYSVAEVDVLASHSQLISESLVLVPGWFSSGASNTRSIAWGDVDADGDLDLAVGDYYQAQVKVYQNVDGMLQTQAGWASGNANNANSIAWGDVDRDGDLDLAIGNGGTHADLSNEIVYLNMDGVLSDTPIWRSDDGDETRSIAWGDVNGDGYPDLAAGNYYTYTKVYLNEHGQLQTTAAYTLGNGTDNTNSVAWGDVNGDGHLDLVAGNSYTFTKVYLNEHGQLQTTAAYTLGNGTDNTNSVAWGDVNGDGYLDLAAGNSYTYTKVYLNEHGQLQTTAAYTLGNGTDNTNSVAWGDVNGDGYLDLAVGNSYAPNEVYLNVGRELQRNRAWFSSDSLPTSSVAWGDVDGDGDLDLASGNDGVLNELYLNMGGVLQTRADGIPDEGHSTRTIALGDVDGDGDLDLAVGNSLPAHGIQVYTNTRGVFQTPSGCMMNCSEADNASSIAWGDVDGDGDLDLAAGNSVYPDGGHTKVYNNIEGVLQAQNPWVSPHTDQTRSVAWGDVDGDGDLDLAVGNAGPNKVYLNAGGVLTTTSPWESKDSDETQSIAWGDVDGDGDLDLAAGNNYAPDKVYLNTGSELQTHAAWILGNNDVTNSIAWGDMDGDGDLDLAAGNGNSPNTVYLNANGVLTTTSAWTSNDIYFTQSIAWGDIDGDGDLDLVTGNGNSSDRVYFSEGGVLQRQAGWVSDYEDRDDTRSIAVGDVDGDGDLDLVAGNTYATLNKVYLGTRPAHPLGGSKPAAIGLDLRSNPVATFSQTMSTALAPADYYAVPGIRSSGFIPITYNLYHPVSETVRLVRAYYSPDGTLPRERNNWRPALSTTDTLTTNLATGPYPTPSITNTHVYTWDVFESGFMGQSDNVVVRVEALPNLETWPNSVPGPFQRPYVSAQTYRFRVRGSQVRVMKEGAPAPGAIVYRLPAGQTGSLDAYRDRSGKAYRTNGSGYLQGYGEMGRGDWLVALVPITATESNTLYYSSGAPTDTGIVSHTVSTLGVQTLTVSSANPLVLFNLDVSLEWDARNDAPFLAQLEQDIRRASELLYDWSNGQAALGKVTVYHAKQHWQDAHVLIYANNRFRPAAMQGGIITDTLAETVAVPITSTSVITYLPGQVAMGPEWNRYGDPGSNLGEDWPRAFAHELAHYALFLDDNYIGLDDAGLLMPVDTCPGAMADPYRDDAASGYGEFHPAANWLPRCQDTLSNRNTGRADWTTVGSFYPWLATTIDNPGPSVLPLSVTEVQVVEPITPTTTLPAPLFLLVQDGNRVLSDARARSYLFQDGWAIDLGQPSQDRLLARGARPGDRLCVYDLSASRLGCETITAGDTELALVAKPNWQPEITVTPVTSVTLVISVSNVVTDPPSPTIKAKLYPLDKLSQGEIVLTELGGAYVGTFQLLKPSLVGTIQVWVDEAEPRREVVSDYVLGGNPARIWSGGARIWSGGARIWSGGARIWSGGAPVASSDGQVALYSPDHAYGPEWFLTVQASSAAPPPWATLVGKAYRVAASGAAPDLTEMSIAFSYLGSDVPPGEEPWLRVYHWDGADWRQLTTNLDKINNMASARVTGPGVYALMSSIEIPLYYPGWNSFGYPILGSRPVTEALISITGVYTTVDYYNPAPPDPLARWTNHDAYWPGELDTLHELEFGKSYLINVSEPVTLFLKGAPPLEIPAEPELFDPPATYYGAVAAGMGFTPTVGMPVTAWIDGHLCGRSATQDVAGQPMVAINVVEDGPGVGSGCGEPGRSILFRVDGMPMTPGAVWDNSHTHQLTFGHCPDFDGNGAVDIADIVAVVQRWGQSSAAPGWQAQYDWDGDGGVDIVDIQQVTAVWGQACPGLNSN